MQKAGIYFLKANISFITGLMLVSYAVGVSGLEVYKPSAYWIIAAGVIGLLNIASSIILLAFYKSRKRKIGENIYRLVSLATTLLLFLSGLALGIEAVKVTLKSPDLLILALIPSALLILAALFYLWLSGR